MEDIHLKNRKSLGQNKGVQKVFKLYFGQSPDFTTTIGIFKDESMLEVGSSSSNSASNTNSNFSTIGFEHMLLVKRKKLLLVETTPF